MKTETLKRLEEQAIARLANADQIIGHGVAMCTITPHALMELLSRWKPDAFCVTQEDGECISNHPLCMHVVRTPE